MALTYQSLPLIDGSVPLIDKSLALINGGNGIIATTYTNEKDFILNRLKTWAFMVKDVYHVIF